MNQSLMHSGCEHVEMFAELAGECAFDALAPEGGPPFGPGLVWLASEAIPLERTTMLCPSRCPGDTRPKPLRIDLARESASAEPSARRIFAPSRPQLFWAFVGGFSCVCLQMPIAFA